MSPSELAQALLLVCEDLHWIDAETQALLDSLVESVPTAQFLLLVNYRPEYQHGWGSKRLSGNMDWQKNRFIR